MCKNTHFLWQTCSNVTRARCPPCFGDLCVVEYRHASPLKKSRRTQFPRHPSVATSNFRDEVRVVVSGSPKVDRTLSQLEEPGLHTSVPPRWTKRSVQNHSECTQQRLRAAQYVRVNRRLVRSQSDENTRQSKSRSISVMITPGRDTVLFPSLSFPLLALLPPMFFFSCRSHLHRSVFLFFCCGHDVQ